MHTPIFIKDLDVFFHEKTCFTNFSTTIYSKNRIGIIGQNGSGKTTLLSIIRDIALQSNVTVGYVEQLIEDRETLSGGERFNKKLNEELIKNPDILLLDEPTNHLDQCNKNKLMNLIKRFPGTIILVSHDFDILNYSIEQLWHINNEKISIIHDTYENYCQTCEDEREKITLKLKNINAQKKDIHVQKMKQQECSSRKKKHAEKKYGNDKLSLHFAQSRGDVASNKRTQSLDKEKERLQSDLNNLYVREIIKPNFCIPSPVKKESVVLSIQNGCVGYNETTILKDIHLFVESNERIAVLGQNGSGKSTLIKAILNDPSVKKSGEWSLHSKAIGYLDQHYQTLNPNMSVFESVQHLKPTHEDIRPLLSTFLFKKNEDVHKLIKNLSGGEKARLSLCHLSINSPSILILDEVTNNLDLITKNHVIDVLNAYTGAIIAISHDDTFLKRIKVTSRYQIKDRTLVKLTTPFL